MGRKLNITSNAQPLEAESNLFTPPPPTPKAPREQREYLVALSWKPTPDKMAQLRGQFPRLDLEEERVKMLAWHHKNEVKRIDWNRTYLDWLKRASGEWAARAVQAQRDQRSGFKRPTTDQSNHPYNPADLRSEAR